MLHIKKIKPLFTSVVTTGERYEEDMVENGLIVANKGDLKTYQKVVAVGETVRGVEVGDTVMINIANYAVRQYDPNSVKNDMGMNKVIKYAFNWLKIDDEKGEPMDCLLLSDRDLLFAFEGEEKNEPVIIPQKKIWVN